MVVLWIVCASAWGAPAEAQVGDHPSHLPETAQNAPAGGTPQKEGVEKAARLDIQITPSRSQITAGSGLGVVATLINRGDTTLWVTEGKVMLAVPPELTRSGEVTAYPAQFPTLLNEVHSGNTFSVPLLPGATYPVYFSIRGLKEKSPATNWFSRRIRDFSLDFVGFNPGKYQVSVVAQAHVTANGSTPPHTFAKTADLQVAAPQGVIVFGAALGGIFAFLLFPQRRRLEEQTVKQQLPNRWVVRRWYESEPYRKKFWGGVLAALWSVLATILLSRISESQFIVHVSVVDFWGAITIGFIAQYGGAKWLERYGEPTANNRGPGQGDEVGRTTPTRLRDDGASGAAPAGGAATQAPLEAQ
jgi:hypothetical protein